LRRLDAAVGDRPASRLSLLRLPPQRHRQLRLLRVAGAVCEGDVDLRLALRLLQGLGDLLGVLGLLRLQLQGLRGASAAEPNICVAAGGEQRVQKGTTDCDANGTGSVAIARAADSEAYAINGDRNRATASGEGSYASASDGDNNTATASGDGSRACAGEGDNNTATASGAGAGDGGPGCVYALGDNSTAIASGDVSFAEAYDGNNNTAIASGDNSGASAYAGDNNTATASGDGSAAAAHDGDNNTATATTAGCTAEAIGGGVTATC
jgi:hypothetical protein